MEELSLRLPSASLVMDICYKLEWNKHILSLQKPPPVLDVQGPGLLVNNPGPGGGAEQQQQGGGEAGHYGLVSGALQTHLNIS